MANTYFITARVTFTCKHIYCCICGIPFYHKLSLNLSLEGRGEDLYEDICLL